MAAPSLAGQHVDLRSYILPVGSRLVHIGPHKTGTTAVQASLWNAREEMLAQGVRFVGRSRHDSAASKAVTRRPSAYSDEIPDMRHWQRLVKAFRAAGEPRAVVSSEFFAWGGSESIRQIARDLGPDRIQIAITLRPLARVLPSMWQQNVQAGMVPSFDDWLGTLFRRAPDKPRALFWTLHRQDELIARWADVVGIDRVTVVVGDERDHGFLLRAFEGLLGLREGTLVADRDLMNRSFTLPETEAVRALNVVFKERGYPKAIHARYIRFGASQLMKRREPPPGEPRIELPEWSIEPITQTAHEMVDGIVASGARVVGDLASLTAVPQPKAGDAAEVVIPPEVTASLAVSVLEATGHTRETGKRPGRFEFAEPAEMVRIPTYQVAAVLALRARRNILRRFRGVRRLRTVVPWRGASPPS